MRRPPYDHGTSQPRSSRMCTAVLSLLIACVSCRDDTVEPLTTAQSPNVTMVAPAAAMKDHRADMESRPAEMDSGPGDMQPVTTNPLGGCDMCHVDVEKEFLGSKHHAERVGCAQCHGPSHGHVADENNDVLPDRVFARGDIDPFCGECHTCSRPPAGEPAAAPPAKQKVCTECHGVHDLRLAGEAGSGPTEETGAQMPAPAG